MFKIRAQIEENGDENVTEPEDVGEFDTLEEAVEAMADLVSIGSDTFRERLIALDDLSFEQFGLIIYDKPCANLEHIREYMLGKYAKFKEDPLGLILTLDSRNFQRVYEYLIVNGGK